MSKFLGIEYNMWHGVIPAIVMPVVMVLSVIKFGASQLTFLLAIAALTVFLLMLQGVNESFQSLSKTIFEDYGSYESFQDNSRDDWMWFLIGWNFGTILSGLFFALIDWIL